MLSTICCFLFLPVRYLFTSGFDYISMFISISAILQGKIQRSTKVPLFTDVKMFDNTSLSFFLHEIYLEIKENRTELVLVFEALYKGLSKLVPCGRI